MNLLYADQNYNTVKISPVLRARDGIVETSVVFSTTLFDPTGSPVSGATALNTTYYPDTQTNEVVLPVSLTTIGSGYAIDAIAGGAFAGKIKFTQSPAAARYRQ